MWETLTQGGTWLRIAGYVLILAGIQLTIRTYIGRVVRRTMISSRFDTESDAEQRADTLTGLFRTALTALIWIIGAVLILNEFNVNLAALATGAGLFGIIIGFGAQSTVKDFLSGIFIIMENQYRIGDVVNIDGNKGVVEQVTIRITKLRDVDGSVYFIPNGEITVVRNMTLEFSGAVIEVGVSYDTDVDKAEEVMNIVGRKLADDPDWSDRIVEPITFLRIDSFGDSSVNLKATGKTAPSEQWSVAGEYRARLKKAFEEAGIIIPLPQRVVHIAKSE